MKILFLGTGAADWIIDQHKELEAQMKRHHIEVAYDGYEKEI